MTALYASPISDEHRPLISDEHNRFYLHKGKLFRFINTKGLKIEGKRLQEKEKDLQQLKEVQLL